jgi:hypothetical protein
MEGTLTIKLLRGEFEKDYSLLGKMSTYCNFICGTQRGKSNTCENGGKTPTWTEVVKFHITNESVIHIHVYARGLIKDSYIGMAEILIPQARIIGTASQLYEVTKMGRVRGKLNLEVIWQEGILPFQSQLSSSGVSNFAGMGTQPRNVNLVTGSLSKMGGSSCGWTNESRYQAPLNMSRQMPMTQSSSVMGNSRGQSLTSLTSLEAEPITIMQGYNEYPASTGNLNIM